MDQDVEVLHLLQHQADSASLHRQLRACLTSSLPQDVLKASTEPTAVTDSIEYRRTLLRLGARLRGEARVLAAVAAFTAAAAQDDSTTDKNAAETAACAVVDDARAAGVGVGPPGLLHGIGSRGSDSDDDDEEADFSPAFGASSRIRRLAAEIVDASTATPLPARRICQFRDQLTADAMQDNKARGLMIQAVASLAKEQDARSGGVAVLAVAWDAADPCLDTSLALVTAVVPVLAQSRASYTVLRRMMSQLPERWHGGSLGEAEAAMLTDVLTNVLTQVQQHLPAVLLAWVDPDASWFAAWQSRGADWADAVSEAVQRSGFADWIWQRVADDLHVMWPVSALSTILSFPCACGMASRRVSAAVRRLTGLIAGPITPSPLRYAAASALVRASTHRAAIAAAALKSLGAWYVAVDSNLASAARVFDAVLARILVAHAQSVDTIAAYTASCRVISGSDAGLVDALALVLFHSPDLLPSLPGRDLALYTPVGAAMCSSRTGAALVLDCDDVVIDAVMALVLQACSRDFLPVTVLVALDTAYDRITPLLCRLVQTDALVLSDALACQRAGRDIDGDTSKASDGAKVLGEAQGTLCHDVGLPFGPESPLYPHLCRFLRCCRIVPVPADVLQHDAQLRLLALRVRAVSLTARLDLAQALADAAAQCAAGSSAQRCFVRLRTLPLLAEAEARFLERSHAQDPVSAPVVLAIEQCSKLHQLRHLVLKRRDELAACPFAAGVWYQLALQGCALRRQASPQDAAEMDAWRRTLAVDGQDPSGSSDDAALLRLLPAVAVPAAKAVLCRCSEQRRWLAVATLYAVRMSPEHATPLLPIPRGDVTLDDLETYDVRRVLSPGIAAAFRACSCDANLVIAHWLDQWFVNVLPADDLLVLIALAALWPRRTVLVRVAVAAALLENNAEMIRQRASLAADADIVFLVRPDLVDWTLDLACVLAKVDTLFKVYEL